MAHYPRVNRSLVEERTLHELSRGGLAAWLGAAALEWSIIAALLWAAQAWPRPWLWVLCALLIGTRQHALGVLAHDGAHHAITPSRFWNDFLANVLAAYPLTFTVEGFRLTHLRHHWYLETPDDPSRVTVENHAPDWTFPMTVRHFARMMLRDLVGLSQRSSLELIKYLWDIPGGRWPHVLRLVLYHAAVIAACAATGRLTAYFLLWIVPLYTVAVACYRVRSVAEHSGIGPQTERYVRAVVDPLTTTRTTEMDPVAKFLFAPYNISYHIEHHLYPSVPVFRLRKLHERLKHDPLYAAKAHVTRRHTGLLRELTGRDAGATA